MLELVSDVKAYEFKLDGKVYSLPSVGSLPMKVYRELMAKINDAEDRNNAATDAFIDLFTRYVPEAMEVMTVDQCAAVAGDWASGGDGPSAGES